MIQTIIKCITALLFKSSTRNQTVQELAFYYPQIISERRDLNSCKMKCIKDSKLSCTVAASLLRIRGSNHIG